MRQPEPRRLIKECDCDLNLDPHPMDSKHWRACKAMLSKTDITCQRIRGHQGQHGAKVVQWFNWS